MKVRTALRFPAFLLSLSFILSCCFVPALASGPALSQETGPAESIPEESVPVPGESVPEEPAPEESVPEESAPPESVPVETAPVETEPEESIPEETLPPESLPPETQPPQLLAAPEEPEAPGPGLYFGSLHAHSAISDSADSVEDVFLAASRTPGLDFFAVTDHSDSFDNHKEGSISADAASLSADWRSGKAAAAAVTGNDFVGIYGYEMSWPANLQLGHISTFGTPGFQSWQQEAFRKYGSALKNYYTALSDVPGSVSQFNHPGSQYGTFLDFEYSEAADQVMTLLELGTGTDACRYYTKALDLGWHLAPTASRETANTARTVVYAQSLTEAAIYDALRSCCAYTTEDTDLEILYTMNGHFMGSRLKRRHLATDITLSVSLTDPSDASAGTTEIITNGGQVAARQTLTGSAGTLTFSLPMNSGYYYLRITQPDGDTAVTAPIWVDAEEQLGISGLVCETAVPVQNKPLLLTLELYNRETVNLDVTSLEVLADGVPVFTDNTLSLLPAGSILSHPIAFSPDCVGLTDLTVRLSGTLEGSSRVYETSLQLSFHRSDQVTSVLVDGSHGNAGLDRLNKWKQMAMAEQIQIITADTVPSAEALKDCRFLLISAPSQPFSDAFLKAVADFAGYGGSIILCGQADCLDGFVCSSVQLNRVLEAVGSSMRINPDTIADTLSGQPDPYTLFPDDLNPEPDWCKGISENQVFRLSYGCTLDPGVGTWMVRSPGNSDAGRTVLACAPLSGGGTVFASGCLLFSDEDLAEPKNLWDEPYANHTLARTFLGIGGNALPLSSIAAARAAAPGTLVRIRGYATTGTSNPHNTFPDMLYLQDDTGGIAATPFDIPDIQQGTPLEIVGTVANQGANRMLKLSSCHVLDAVLYQPSPMSGSWSSLLATDDNSQRLIRVEGKCLEIYCREDDTLAGCLLTDNQGNTLQIRIEDHIRNGSDGENQLHKTIRKGRTVRADGLLHIDEYGEAVVRVRNCEEVVWVPPRNYWNPKTGDRMLPAAIFCSCASLSALLFLRKRKKS